jgi:hypothetical protein
MEDRTINVLHKIDKNVTFRRRRCPRNRSSGQDVDQRGSSSVERFPGLLDPPTNPQMDPYQQPDAGDADLKALWSLFVRIQPALSSLLRDLGDCNAAQEESAQVHVEEAISTIDVEIETINQTNESKSQSHVNVTLLKIFIFCC